LRNPATLFNPLRICIRPGRRYFGFVNNEFSIAAHWPAGSMKPACGGGRRVCARNSSRRRFHSAGFHVAEIFPVRQAGTGNFAGSRPDSPARRLFERRAEHRGAGN